MVRIIIAGTRGRVPGGALPSVTEPWSHVPIILFGPNMPAGVRIEKQVRLEDLPATALTAMGFVKRRFGDGYSLMALVEGKDLGNLQALTVSPPRTEDGRCAIALREGSWKYVRDVKGDASLYDLEDDSREVDDIQEDHEDRTNAARSHIRELLGKDQPEVIMLPLDPGRARVLKTLRDI